MREGGLAAPFAPVCPRQGGGIPAAVTARAPRSLSDAISAANRAASPVQTCPPMRVICAATSALSVMATISRESRSRIAAGIPAGAITPNQIIISKPGTPASSIVGTSGSAGCRSRADTASGLALPDWMCGTMVPTPSKMIGTSPARKAVITGAEPRYGIATMSVPVWSLNVSNIRCTELPTPGMP